LAESVGERNLATQPPVSSGCPWGELGARWRCMYLRPKDQTAMVGVCDCATQKASEEYDR